MGKSEQRAKNAKMAAELIKRGFPHGRRWSRPYANSGGTNMVMNQPGSSKNQRRSK